MCTGKEWEWEYIFCKNGNGNWNGMEIMGMGGNGNGKTHSRTPLFPIHSFRKFFARTYRFTTIQKAKMAVSMAVAAKPEVEIWRRPKKSTF